eukprot:CAMPEP_0174834580 /NCGR_PEP_ID=MMETSP1114-20130205/4909_1 /TAXON_ID=312471 /ORGANISM="Neobodo designis, Strain CCAP 1951/1" /LENGTH=61 /DNA_ID=CAMNT_0016068495 /DNA_START=82 /DNA_END=267 /DNA_ORIENTATION=-
MDLWSLASASTGVDNFGTAWRSSATACTISQASLDGMTSPEEERADIGRMSSGASCKAVLR